MNFTKLKSQERTNRRTNELTNSDSNISDNYTRNCIKVYPRNQIVKVHLHFNTPGNLFSFFRKILNEIVISLQLNCNMH